MALRHTASTVLTLIALSLPGLALAALAGVNYAAAPPPGAQTQQQGQQPGQQQPGTGGASPYDATASSGSGGGGSSGGSGGGGAGGGGSGGGGAGISANQNAVSAILHPASNAQKAAAAKAALKAPDPMTEHDTQDIVMANSLNSYTGYCACPYSRNSDGFECGVEAQYYKPGGFRILCYPQDVRGQLNIFYRKTH